MTTVTYRTEPVVVTETAYRRKKGSSLIALDLVRKKIMNSVTTVEREVNQFLHRYAGNVGTPSNWPRYIHTAGNITGQPYETLRDYKDLEEVFRHVRGDPELAAYTHHEYDELRRMIERAKMFEYIEYTLKNDLVSAYEDQLDTFCVSFYHQSYGDNLKSVKEYEDKIVAWRSEIQQRLDRVDHDMDEIDKHAESLQSYVDNYPMIVMKMEESCLGIIGSCETMKRWLVADAQYPKAIQDEISSYTRRKQDLKDVLETTEESRMKQAKRLRKAAATKASYEKQLTVANDELRYFQRREQDVQEGYVRVDAELQRKLKDLEGINEKRREKKSNSPSQNNYLNGMAETVKMEIQALEEKMNNMVKQVDYLKKDESKVQREIERLQNIVETSNENQESVTARFNKEGEDLDLVHEDIENRNEKISVLKKIREVKLHSHILKKIQKFGYHPEKLIEVQAVINDETRDAFRITSDGIGKDWIWLYQSLPFNPPRDTRQRDRDVEIIDITHRRLDQGYDLLALKSLEKWRRLSSMATVDELVHTLKKMKKNNLASQIVSLEKRYQQAV